MKKKMINVDEATHQQAKVQAAIAGMTLADYVAMLVRKDNKNKKENNE